MSTTLHIGLPRSTHGLPGEDDIGGSLLDDEAGVGADEEPSKIGRHFAITNIAGSRVSECCTASSNGELGRVAHIDSQ